MTTQRKLYQIASSLLLSGLIGFGTIALSASASERNGETLSQGLPGRRIGGGTRGSEIAARSNQQPLTALIPENHLNVTAAAYPSLLFHVPALTTPQSVEFVLRNEADELVYDAMFETSDSGGIVRIDLAEADGLAPLRVGQNYRWYFSIVNPGDRSKDISVDGWIQRIDLATWVQQQGLEEGVVEQIDGSLSLTQASVLHEQMGLWSDAALVLNELRRTQPTNLSVAAEWESLLAAVGLENLSHEPVADRLMASRTGLLD
ncbi:MAG: DUF928 domain-containing protein [Leptolyngbya sp. SIO4C1]|nr:DUF928 domain-containing protein [Leptolyngbya sp. SIO4C1]